MFFRRLNCRLNCGEVLDRCEEEELDDTAVNLAVVAEKANYSNSR